MKTVLSVGQCGYDGPRIKSLLEKKCGAIVETASNTKEALEKITSNKYDLILVNRVFNINHEPGLELIKTVHSKNPDQKIMLVSNFEESQKEALEKGAVQGFGKDALKDIKTVNTIRVALGLGETDVHDTKTDTGSDVCPAE